MITVRTSPAYVNRVRQDWTANGGVYGDGGVYAVVPSNDPFAQLGPTLDLTFAGVPTDQFTAATTDGYSINLNLSSEIYQIAVEYAVWSGYQVNYALLPTALSEAGSNIEPAKTLFKDTLIGGRPLGDITNDGLVTSADALAYTRFNSAFWLNTADRNDYIRTVLNPYMLANPGLYAAYLTPSTGLAQQTFAEIITFTRTGTGGTFFNSAGVLTAAAADQPRFDYNPSTLAAQGLLIEEQRTNSIRNNTMQGAVAGAPGTLPTNWAVSGFSGLTREIVGVGLFNGVTYVDIKYSGTSSGAFGDIYFEGTNVIGAANGQSWAVSAWVQVVAGTQNGVSSINFGLLQYDSGGVALGAATLGAPSATINTTWQRINRIGTTNNASIAFVRPQIAIGIASGQAIDITLRIGLPQLELGAFATSVIPTTTTALTRSADVASVNTLSPWYNAIEGTIFCQGLTPPGLANFPSIGPALSDGTANNAIIQYVFTNGYYSGARVGGVSQGNTSITTTPTIGSQYKFATAYANNDSQSALNGTASTVDNTYTVPTANQMRINTNGTVSGNLPNSWIQRITYYPRRLSNADLQTITI